MLYLWTLKNKSSGNVQIRNFETPLQIIFHGDFIQNEVEYNELNSLQDNALKRKDLRMDPCFDSCQTKPCEL